MTEPNIHSWHPVLGVASMQQALEYYVDWLGFSLLDVWQEAPGEPKIAWVQRDGIKLALNEFPDAPGAVWLNLMVRDAQALADEWNGRRPGSVEVVSGVPYEFPVVYLRDPFGNRLDVQQQLTAEEEDERRQRMPEMRTFIQARIAAGRPVPSPDEVVAAVGPSVGIAIEVLNEFPEYAAQFADDSQSVMRSE